MGVPSEAADRRLAVRTTAITGQPRRCHGVGRAAAVAGDAEGDDRWPGLATMLLRQVERRGLFTIGVSMGTGAESPRCELVARRCRAEPVDGLTRRQVQLGPLDP
jgi:hypothetical protein